MRGVTIEREECEGEKEWLGELRLRGERLLIGGMNNVRGWERNVRDSQEYDWGGSEKKVIKREGCEERGGQME